MTLSIVCGATGAAISCVGAVKYYKAILKEGARPSIASWLAWTLSWAVLLAGALGEASGVAIIFTAVGALRSLLVIVLARAKNVRCMPQGYSEWFSIMAAFACIAAVAVSPGGSPLSVLLAAAANFIATWPTIRQAWGRPYADSPYVFMGNAAACTIVCFGIVLENNLAFNTLSGPTASLIGNCAVVTVLYARRRWSIIMDNMALRIDMIKAVLGIQLVAGIDSDQDEA